MKSSRGRPHMDEQRQEVRLGTTYNSSVPIQYVALKTYRKRWTTEKSGRRGSGRSVLMVRHDDDDDDDILWIGLIRLMVNFFMSFFFVFDFAFVFFVWIALMVNMFFFFIFSLDWIWFMVNLYTFWGRLKSVILFISSLLEFDWW